MRGQMENGKELHLFIIWEKARYAEKEILAEIECKFNIVQTYSITWSRYQVGNNFTRFYGANLPRNSGKEKHCGSGEFKLIVVIDEKPKYEDRLTSKGVRRVNANMFDTKSILRSITGGGHKIHGTDSEEETKHDLVLLTGLSISDFLRKHTQREEDVIYKSDLLGCHGWDSFEQLFYVLNECSEYIVLRNVENIDLEYIKQNKGDIDLLVKNAEGIKYVLGDLTNINKSNSHMHVAVCNHEVLFEVYQSGLNLFHEKFESELFKSKNKVNNIYCPSKVNEMYGLIYHALLNKPKFEDKHKKRIFNNYAQYIEDKDKSEAGLLNKLLCYFETNSYMFIKPNFGYFNARAEIKGRLIKNKNRDGFFRRKINKIFDIKCKGRKLEIYILKLLKNQVVIKIKFPKGIRFCFYLGLK
jgi:hypothetical protein